MRGFFYCFPSILYQMILSSAHLALALAVYAFEQVL
jgi:hypothetical protein